MIKNAPDTGKGCIYKIPCKMCPSFYIGTTGKQIHVRLQQHKNSIRYAQENSAVFVHVRNFDHPMDWNNTCKLGHSNNIIERNIIESCLIKESFARNMNISTGMFNLDPLISKEICKLYNK